MLEPFRLIKSSYSNDHTVSSKEVVIVCFYFSQAISMAHEVQDKNIYKCINSSPIKCMYRSHPNTLQSTTKRKWKSSHYL